ncbi:NADH dehydrogenase [ubiquinone] 1 beta subcomplex subunit 1-like [Felis catus]|uniref:NADH dehydrogenase [ubiquinone] 1 beta subcomplex subunit 1-like n=1 Tax=Felis catus TaxID=9685 RepID=UPI001D1A3019|nr:NADH dehydrogenase [ubiquinone] 1 beta subcomplex subunit 1-like [Felis catus]
MTMTIKSSELKTPSRVPLPILELLQTNKKAQKDVQTGRGVVFGTKAAALMTNVTHIACDHWVHILVPMGFVLGCYLDRKNEEKLTAFWNKSLLFKRELRPSEEVTWK